MEVERKTVDQCVGNEQPRQPAPTPTHLPWQRDLMPASRILMRDNPNGAPERLLYQIEVEAARFKEQHIAGRRLSRPLLLHLAASKNVEGERRDATLPRRVGLDLYSHGSVNKERQGTCCV